jgi:hypothetical protein
MNPMSEEHNGKEKVRRGKKGREGRGKERKEDEVGLEEGFFFFFFFFFCGKKDGKNMKK